VSPLSNSTTTSTVVIRNDPFTSTPAGLRRHQTVAGEPRRTWQAVCLSLSERFRAHYATMAEGDPVLEDRLLAAIDADDAACEAAFWGWPAGARVCRIADLDGQEVASVARFS